jgi:hypothetical protein
MFELADMNSVDPIDVLCIVRTCTEVKLAEGNW